MRVLLISANSVAVPAVARAVNAFRPDVIGISLRNIDDQDMAKPTFLLEPVRDIVAACRATRAAPVVLCGAGCSMAHGSTFGWLSKLYVCRQHV